MIEFIIVLFMVFLGFKMVAMGKEHKRLNDIIISLQRRLSVLEADNDKVGVSEADKAKSNQSLDATGEFKNIVVAKQQEVDKRFVAKTQTEEIKVEAIKTEAIKSHSVDNTQIDTQNINTNQEIKRKHKVPSFNRELFSVESIISKLGILLLLIGVGFIYKFAYDQGYIVRGSIVFIGGVAGSVFIVFGHKIRHKKRMVLSRVLIGGGIAILYISTYSAYQVYEMLPVVLAFIFMVIITVSAFIFAVTINSPIVSVIGIIGGLLTPFIIELDYSSLTGLSIYIGILGIGSMIIYVIKRWRILQVASVMGTLYVTSYLVYLNGFSIREPVRLSVLIVFLLVLYNGTDYVLDLLGKESSRYKWVTLTLFALLPMTTLFQINELLDITDLSWSIIFGVVALIYMAMTGSLYHKKGNRLTSDITLSLTAIFILLAITIIIGGEVETIAIISVSLMFYLIGKKRSHNFTNILGHIIYGIGFVGALINLVEGVLRESVTWVDILTRVIILVLLTCGVLFQKKPIRYIHGIATFGIYMIFFLQSLLYNYVADYEALAIMIVFYGVLLYVLLLITKKLDCIPQMSIFVLGLIPFIVRLLMIMVVVFMGDVNTTNMVAFVIYSVMFYGLSYILFDQKESIMRVVMKMVSYAILMITLFADIAMWGDNVGYGLVLDGLLLLALKYVEPDRENKFIKIYIHSITGLWLFSFVLYSLLDFYRGFVVLPFVADIVILVILYIIIQSLKFKIGTKMVVGINTAFYMLIIYQNFKRLSYGGGIITLLWAAYAIGLLTVSVVKSMKDSVVLSLIMIIIVVAKFVFIDLSVVNILWKIIISMAFGMALLILSYVLQPILAKHES